MKKLKDSSLIIVHPNLDLDVLLHTRCQHAIGQGGFHTGQLFAPSDSTLVVRNNHVVEAFARAPFRYVYDCGSRQTSRCNKVIQRYIKEKDSKTLDMLFLSHFDEDHVNGVPVLLDAQQGARVDTIVMPWVDDVERMIAFARAKARKSKIGPFFEALLIDPVDALTTFGPRQILFVRSGPDEPDAGVVEIGPWGPGPDTGFRIKIRSETPEGRIVPPHGSRWHSDTTVTIMVDHRAALDVSIGSSNFSWLLKPYVRPVDPILIARFEREAERRLKWSWGTFRHEVADKTVRRHLVANHTQSQALAGAYKTVFGNRNLTSLCLYSGPNVQNTLELPLMVELNVERCRSVNKIGWLGTGDIPLADPVDANAFLLHFHAQQAAVATLGLPHHGAKPNHSMHVLSVLRPATCLASAKPPKNWQHPHPDVIADVTSIGAWPAHVSDDDTTAFNEAFAILV